MTGPLATQLQLFSDQIVGDPAPGPDAPVGKGRRYRVALDETTIEYEIVRSRRRRRTVEIAVDRRRVLVRAPQRAPLAEIRAVVVRHARWILGRLAQPPPERPQPLADGGELSLLGRKWPLIMAESDADAPRVALGRTGLLVRVSAESAPEPREEAVRAALVDWCRRRAAALLPRRVARWARRGGLAPSLVLVRQQRRLWGSCSADGTIRLNWRLLMVAPRLIDYVIVHELAHLRVRNHSAAFWAEVGRVLPDHRLLRAELNRQLPELRL